MIWLRNSLITRNAATGNLFEISSTSDSFCSVGGGCIFSALTTDVDYSNSVNCEFIATATGTLKVVKFSTEMCCDKLQIDGLMYSGDTGPDGLAITAGESLTFSSDSSITMSGFEICYTSTSSGGAIYTIGGTLSIINSSITENNATLNGGALFIDGADVSLSSESSISNNDAFLGTAVYFAMGSFEAEGLSLDGNFAGSGSSSAACSSPCTSGFYGDCMLASGALRCSCNCECLPCPAGTYSAVVGATSEDVCTPCGGGQVFFTQAIPVSVILIVFSFLSHFLD